MDFAVGGGLRKNDVSGNCMVNNHGQPSATKDYFIKNQRKLAVELIVEMSGVESDVNTMFDGSTCPG